MPLPRCCPPASTDDKCCLALATRLVQTGAALGGGGVTGFGWVWATPLGRGGGGGGGGGAGGEGVWESHS